MIAGDVFVFGSNLAGRHGRGAALYARRFCGAEYGNPEGIQGRSYAIPTKDKNFVPLPLEKIATYVDKFLAYAEDFPELVFEVTKIGCGLAGYLPEQIAPMFKNIPANVQLPQEFLNVLHANPEQ